MSATRIPPSREGLLNHAVERLRLIAASILRADFPVLARTHDPDSILHRAWPGLLRALETVPVADEDQLARLAAHKIRQVLLKLIERRRRELRPGPDIDRTGLDFDPDQPPRALLDDTDDPNRLAELAEIHRLVDRLPDDERAVFELHYYLDVPQARVAQILDIPPRKVSRLWIAAVERLARHLRAAERN